jgi:AraC-like ligand binding domain
VLRDQTVRATKNKPSDFAQYFRCLHDFYVVSLNYGGRGAFECRRESHDAAPGTCNLIAPGDQ